MENRNYYIEVENSSFPVSAEQDEDGVYIVSCSVFRGCSSYGKSVDDANKNIKEVIELCLAEEKD